MSAAITSVQRSTNGSQVFLEPFISTVKSLSDVRAHFRVFGISPQRPSVLHALKELQGDKVSILNLAYKLGKAFGILAMPSLWHKAVQTALASI